MPATDGEVRLFALIIWVYVNALIAVYYSEWRNPTPEPAHPPLHRRHFELEARVYKLDAQVLELQALLTPKAPADSTTTCEYSALLRSTNALDESLKQLEAFLPPKPPS